MTERGYVIEVEFDDVVEAQRAYDAIERLLGEMGQIGTLGMRPLPSAPSTGETKEQTHRRYYDAFHAWFMQSGCDFWSECDAPESLATIAVELHDNAKAALASTGERPAPESPNPFRASLLARMQEIQDKQPASPAAVVDYTERAREIVTGWYDSGPYVEDLTKDVAAALSAVASERDATAIRAFGQRAWSDTEEVAYQAGVSDTRARLREPDLQKAVAEALTDYTDTEYLAAASALTKIAEMLK